MSDEQVCNLCGKSIRQHGGASNTYGWIHIGDDDFVMCRNKWLQDNPSKRIGEYWGVDIGTPCNSEELSQTQLVSRQIIVTARGNNA